MTSRDSSPRDLTGLATSAASKLQAELGVDAVLVIVIDADVDEVGGGLASNAEVPYDAIVGCTVEVMGRMRPMLNEPEESTKDSIQ